MKLKKLEGGLRLKRKSKKKPLITIITVVRNGEKTLERTIKSVINQTYKNINYIIIDGGSTDNTINVIKKYNNKIDYWVSESDKGIYDAMNKGILLANGEYIYFLGCDDYIYNSQVILKVSKKVKETNADLIYGNVEYTLNNKRKISPNKEIKLIDIKLGNKICHQGLFIKRDVLLNQGLFDLKYKIASDWDQISKSFLSNCKFVYFPIIIAVYNIYGISSKGSFKENSNIINNYFGFFWRILYFIRNKFRGIFIKISLILKRLNKINFINN